MRALIIETGLERGALAAARALHAAGWTVGVATPTGNGLASASRATTHRYEVPPPQADLELFVDAVNRAVRAERYEIVFGGGDAEATALSLCREAIQALVPYASHDQVMRSVHKLGLAAAAEASGMAVPKTVEFSDEEAERWHPPFIVKAALHAPLTQETGTGRLDVVVAGDRAQASHHAAAIRAAGGVPLLQSLARGRLMACAVVANPGGELVASCTQIADACWPPAVGVSARARTLDPEPKLLAGVSTLLERLGWFGLAQLQFILPDQGGPLLIDFNGRFYGSLALAVAAGVNLPAIWAALAVGRSAPAPVAAAPGIRYQWLEGDLRRAALERRGGFARDVAECLRYSRGAVHAIWAPGDPGPAAHGLARLPLRFAGRLRS